MTTNTKVSAVTPEGGSVVSPDTAAEAKSVPGDVGTGRLPITVKHFAALQEAGLWNNEVASWVIIAKERATPRQREQAKKLTNEDVFDWVRRAATRNSIEIAADVERLTPASATSPSASLATSDAPAVKDTAHRKPKPNATPAADHSDGSLDASTLVPTEAEICSASPTDLQVEPPQTVVEQPPDPAINRPVHAKEMARDFLAALDPNAGRFTFQFFGDGPDKYAEIFHGTLDEVWPTVLALNTLERRVAAFVTVNETDLKGRRTQNIVRARALFVDADGSQQATHCLKEIEACGVKPSMIVKSGGGVHLYFPVEDLPLDQFKRHQISLSDRLGSDPAVNDLPRVMRLPGTLHLKNPSRPKLVGLHRSRQLHRWAASDLVEKLGLSLTTQPAAATHARRLPDDFTPEARECIQKIFGHIQDNPWEGMEANTEDIRSAVSVIPASVISTEGDWMKFARALAHEAAINKNQAEELYAILDAASRRAPNYDEEDNRHRWLRYLGEAFDHDSPITIGTIFHLATQHGWQGRSPPAARPTGPATDAASFGIGATGGGSGNAPGGASGGASGAPSSTSALNVSFANIPHRRWLYGIDAIRGEVTVMGSPGGAGKTSLALAMAISTATGQALLGEKIFGTNLTSLYINAEDSGLEMRRRAWAFCIHHGVAEQDLSRLYTAGTDDPRVQGLSFLKNDRKSLIIDREGFNCLEDLLRSVIPDLLVLDPFVALCGVTMNDPGVMSLVMRELKTLAIKYNCAILVIHHTRKGGEPGTAEAISGASSIPNLARRAIMPVTMTEPEAKAYHILPSDRFRYFKVVDAKSNLAPRSADAPWYELVSVELPNAEPPIYPHGDRVQAVVRAKLSRKSSSSADPEQEKIRFELLKLIDRGLTIDGETAPYSPNATGKNKQRAILAHALAAVETVLEREYPPADLRALVERELEALKHEGWAVIEKIKSGRFRRSQGLRSVWDRTPWAKERDSLKEHGGPTVRSAEEQEDLERADREGMIEKALQPGGKWVNGVVND